MPRPSWKQEDIDYLILNYAAQRPKDIAIHLNKSLRSLYSYAFKLNIKKPEGSQRRSNVEILLDGSLQSNYWIGFLLADGHFHKRGNTLRLDQSVADIEHLRTFKKYINLLTDKETIAKSKNSNRKDIASVTCVHSDAIPKLVKLYDICSTKTYNPPNFVNYSHLSENQWMALIIGFIDGDGYINLEKSNQKANNSYTRIKINIEIHSAWQANLEYMKKILYTRANKSHRMTSPKINNNGLVSTVIASSAVIDSIIDFINDNNLYVLERKWSKHERIAFYNRHII